MQVPQLDTKKANFDSLAKKLAAIESIKNSKTLRPKKPYKVSKMHVPSQAFTNLFIIFL